MSSLNGDFDLNGREFHYQILEVQDYDGFDWSDIEGIEEHIQESDMVFYVATDSAGEEYYRWLGGPFEDIDSVVAAIEDETDTYEGVA